MKGAPSIKKSEATKTRLVAFRWWPPSFDILRTTLARDTLHLAVSQVLRTAIQAAYFILLARSLGADSYGSFVAITAAAALLSPFSGLGTSNLFIRDVRSGRLAPAVCWGNGILITIISGTVLSFGTFLVSTMAGIHLSSSLVAAVCLSDLILMRLAELTGFGLAASHRMKDNAILTVVVSGLRFLGIVFLILATGRVTISSWSYTYAFVTALGAIYALIRGAQLWGRPRLHLRSLQGNLVEGLYYSVGTSATTIYNDIDKIMLARLSDLASAGIYGAAYRVVDASMTPVRCLVSAAYPQFFEKGVYGLTGTYAYARRLINRSMLYGLAIAVLLWCMAPILPHILGESYRAAAPALRMLAVIPFLRSIHSFLADALSGSGYQLVRMFVQVGIALLNVGLNLVILPRWSWRGAAWTSVACDGALVVVLFLTVSWFHRRERSVAVAEPLARV